jgi:hypothetical protein
MKPVESKTVKIGEVTFIVRNDNLALSYMLDCHNEADNEITKSVKWFYCLSKAGAAFKEIDFNYTYDEFFKYLNIYGTDAISEFNNALGNQKDNKKK